MTQIQMLADHTARALKILSFTIHLAEDAARQAPHAVQTRPSSHTRASFRSLPAAHSTPHSRSVAESC
eukprot:2001334-Prymnesium_polylepis.1